MMSFLRQRVAEVIAEASEATLVTNGPAGVQAGYARCHARGEKLYVLVPCISEHLVNLEANAAVVVVTPGWELRGTAATVDKIGVEHLFLAWRLALEASAIIEVRPLRLQILNPDHFTYAETIDLGPL